MTVEKFIRILGYIVYCILWSPVIVLSLLIVPFMYVAIFVRMDFTVREAIGVYLEALRMSIEHDAEFIRTGVWY